MKDVVDKATVRAVRYNADGATKDFYAKLMEKQFQSTRCAKTGKLFYPPRPFSIYTGGEVEWVDLPKRGTLYAFSQQHRSLRFFTPDVLGLVELPDVDGLVFTKIDGSLESLSIGQQVELDFFEISKDLIVHQFRPV